MTNCVRPRILLVDDDLNLLAGLERQLRDEYEVAIAASASEALKLVVAQGPFAVVVSDLQMPGMDGVTLLYCLCRAAPDTVRVVLTGHADVDAAVRPARCEAFISAQGMEIRGRGDAVTSRLHHPRFGDC